MENVLVLLDFTETADLALHQAMELTAAKGGKLILCHVFKHALSTDEMKAQMKPYTTKLDAAGASYELALISGEFYSQAKSLTERIKPDLLVVGTHGKKGLKQNLLGSNIHKLVSTVDTNSLVVSDIHAVKKGGFSRVLLPVSSHADFDKKVEGAIRLLAENGELLLFALFKPGVPLSESVNQNIEKTKKLLDGKGINWSKLEVDAKKFSVGYSKETLEILEDQGADLVSIMVEVSEEGLAYGKIDKENIILNLKGAAVLCINS